ncbi:MAG: hypothetical protein ABIF71_10520 [Planctomycetota bacterium]
MMKLVSLRTDIIVVMIALTVGLGLGIGRRSALTHAPTHAPTISAVPAPAAIMNVPVSSDITADLVPGPGCAICLDVKNGTDWQVISFRPGTVAFTTVRAGIAVIVSECPIPGPAGASIGARIELRPQYAALYLAERFVADIPLALEAGCDLGLGPAVTPTAVRCAPAPPPFLKDDFMRVEQELGDWERTCGTWKIKSMVNPSMSANAFSLQGAGADATVLAGRTDWNNYDFGISLNTAERTAVGIITAWTDSRNYTLALWSEKDFRLVRVTNGELQLVVEAALQCRPGQWYRLSGTVGRHGFELDVDGHPVLRDTEPRLRVGRFGLFVNGTGPAFFDDVEITAARTAILPAANGGVLPFRTVGGEWSAGEGGYRCRTTEPARAVWGGAHWANYRVRATVGSEGGRAGVGLYYGDVDNYYAAVRDGGSVKLISRTRDGEAVLAAYPLSDGEAKEAILLALAVRNAVITVTAGDRALGAVLNRDHAAGRPFLFAENNDVLFRDAVVEFVPYAEAVTSENEIFTAENTMTEWAGAQSDWLLQEETFKGAVLTTLWNKAAFPGDVLVEANITGFDPAGKVRLMLAAAERRIDSGYSFGLNSGASREALLLKGGEIIARAPLEPQACYARLGFQRIGTMLAGLLDDTVILSHAATGEDLVGTNAGWTVSGTGITRDDVWAFSDALYDYNFTTSPAEWRVAGGTWEVTNRWHCDPRWRFFSGRRDQGGAVIWNKRLFPGDGTVEFYVAIKMDESRGGNKYGYASDMNVLVAGNGRDVVAGYNCMLGGFGNTKNCIMRNGTVVAETIKALIPADNSIHRRWFYVRVERRGAQITFAIDGTTLLTYTDPDPCAGDRIAFWTWSNGIMVARVRISSSAGGVLESSWENYPAEARTVYDK